MPSVTTSEAMAQAIERLADRVEALENDDKPVCKVYSIICESIERILGDYIKPNQEFLKEPDDVPPFAVEARERIAELIKANVKEVIPAAVPLINVKIDDGICGGWWRSHKHDEDPPIEQIIETTTDYILNNLNEIIKF